MFGMGKSKTAEEGGERLERPLPDPNLLQRPGTSGTELGLRTERQRASSAYVRAQRAEQAYRAKKQATSARQNMSAARSHYAAALKSISLGTRFAWASCKMLPGIVGERRANVAEKRDGVRREKTIRRKKKLEEEMRRHENEIGES